jgi:hypothetical protein
MITSRSASSATSPVSSIALGPLVIAPLRVVGGTGSPANPLAVF